MEVERWEINSKRYFRRDSSDSYQVFHRSVRTPAPQAGNVTIEVRRNNYVDSDNVVERIPEEDRANGSGSQQPVSENESTVNNIFKP